MIRDAHGVPLAVTLTTGNAHDVTQLLPLVEVIPLVRGKPRRRRLPEVLAADRGDDSTAAGRP